LPRAIPRSNLPATRATCTSSWGTRVARGGASGTKSEATGYSVLELDSMDAARELVADYPHLAVPGASIEVFEYLPM